MFTIFRYVSALFGRDTFIEGGRRDVALTRMAHDTLGISARPKEYTVETTLTELDEMTGK